MSGQDRKGVLANGTKAQIKAEVEQIFQDALERFILAADFTVPYTTPWVNLKAGIDLPYQLRRLRSLLYGYAKYVI